MGDQAADFKRRILESEALRLNQHDRERDVQRPNMRVQEQAAEIERLQLKLVLGSNAGEVFASWQGAPLAGPTTISAPPGPPPPKGGPRRASAPKMPEAVPRMHTSAGSAAKDAYTS